MASETVDPIDWSHPPPYTGQYPLSSTYCTVQFGMQITRLTALTVMRTCDLRNARPTHCLCGHSGYRQPSTRLQKCAKKTGRTKPRKHLPRSDLSRNTRQDFLKIQSLWEAALETERRCFSNVILKSNVTPNITRSSESSSTVPPIVNGCDSGCIVRDLETQIVLVLLSFNFVP